MANSRLGLRTRPGVIRGYTEATAIDRDVQSFLTASGITDTNQINAIIKLVADLKEYNLWVKLNCIYPFIGGSSSSHAINLKSPGTNDLTFSGGWTHDANGADPNGTTAFANTTFTPVTLPLNSIHLSVYNREEFNGGVEMGSTTASNAGIDAQVVSRLSNINFSSLNALGVAGFSQSISTGLCIVNRTSSSGFSYFRNNVKTSVTLSSSSANSVSIYIAARNANGTAELYEPRQKAFSSIGQGLTDTEASNLYTAVQAFQTTLGRQV